MSDRERAVVFVRERLSPSHATGVSELYERGRKTANALGESSIRRAIWHLVSRGRSPLMQR